MIIDVHIIAYNEEKIIPYAISHYHQFCRHIYLWDNFSTDSTVKKAKFISDKVIVKQWRAKEGIDERAYLLIKQGFRNFSLDADFVICADADELYFFQTSYLEDCKAKGITLPKVVGYEMLSENFDFKSSLFNITFGVEKENLGKRCVFSPKIEMIWDVGCHPSPVGVQMLSSVKGIVEDEAPKVVLKHYKWINIDYVISRYKVYGERLSEFNKKHGLGFHYLKSEYEIREEFNSMIKNSKEVLV